MAISQANRPIRVVLGEVPPDDYMLTGFKGREAISELYEFELTISSPADKPLDFKQILGKGSSIQFELPGGETRRIHGIISKFSQGKKDSRFISYTAVLVPPLWILTKMIRSATFQQMATKDILDYMFVIAPIQKSTIQLDAKYFPRNFTAQYRESDYNFATRLMEEEGIFYYFAHNEKDLEFLVHDSPSKHRDLPGKKQLNFNDAGSPNLVGELITQWNKSQELHTGSVELTDHIFEMPQKDLKAFELPIDKANAGTIEHDLTIGNREAMTLTDAPGDYARWRDGIDQGGGERASDVEHVFDDASRIALARLQQIQSLALVIEGVSTVPALMPGFVFTLENHFDADGDYVITSVEHRAKCGVNVSGDPEKFTYENNFTCMPKGIPFRPQYNAEWPYISGTQTGVVIGTDDAEIEPDKFGRVKVLFRWDPAGARQLETSCWVRVAQQWAGRQWGFQFIPRIGDEVIVAFEEGNPDKPIILGSVYNADNLPIYKLPDNKTQSGIKTTSSPKGTSENFNEIKFEDKKGAEFISIHAEHNMMTSVENLHTLNVGATAESAGSDTKKAGTMSTTVYGDTSLTVTKGDFTQTIKEGKSTTTIKGNTKVTIEKGNYSFDVQNGESVIHVKGYAEEHYDDQFWLDAVKPVHIQSKTSNVIIVAKENLECTADAKIVLTSGSSSITMLKDGTITIKGKDIKIEGSASVSIKGPDTKIEGATSVGVTGGGAATEWKGGKLTENGPSGVAVTGATIKLNS